MTHLKKSTTKIAQKRSAKKIVNFKIAIEDQKNVVGRLRYALENNPQMSVLEFLHRSKLKYTENKQIVELLRKHFGDLSIEELRMSHIDYFIGIYTKDPKIIEEIIKRIKSDTYRQEYRIIRQRIDFVNKFENDKNYRLQTIYLLDKLKGTKIDTAFENFKLRNFNFNNAAFRIFKKECPDLTLKEIKELVNIYLK